MKPLASCLAQIVLSFVLSVTMLGFVRAADAPKPNIILILADDLGWAEFGVLWQHVSRATSP